MNLFVTGGCGFIGSNFVHAAIERGHTVLNYDALTYAGNLENVAHLATHPDYTFVHGDICDVANLRVAITLSGIEFDACINFAAESHVDRSISAARIFTETNVLGTATLLETMRQMGIPLFIQISTDEVYGSIEGGEKFTLASPLNPSSPYSATKASADLLALAFHHTYNYDVRITRCTNNFGRFQYPEKFIPTIITRALAGEIIPVFGDGKQVRDWIHVDDHCAGILKVLEKGHAGHIYHFGGSNERENVETVRSVLAALAKCTGAPEDAFTDLIKHTDDRLGHDRRYALDWSETGRELAWSPATDFEQALERTVQWYVENPEWLRDVMNREDEQVS